MLRNKRYESKNKNNSIKLLQNFSHYSPGMALGFYIKHCLQNLMKLALCLVSFEFRSFQKH